MRATLATTSLTVRRATPQDDAACAECFAQIAMEADLRLSVRRDPDFAALYRLQTTDWTTWVVDDDGAIEGIGTVLARHGYLDGQVRRVGYLGDLRLSPRAEGRLLLDRFYAPILQEAAEQFGCEHFLTAIIASNARAMRALTRETGRSQRAGRPRYTLLQEFDIRNLHVLPPRRRTRTRFHVRRANDADVPALARLLDADSRRRPFGFVFTEAELRRRLREWPGLAVDSYYLAESPNGQLEGCFALWDATPVKRTLALEYRGGMRRVRVAYDLAARLLGKPRLPREGEPFRYLYATHHAVPSDDANVMRALLDAAYRDVRGRGYHFISVCVPTEDPLRAAYRGYAATDLRARLYAVTLPGVDVPASWIGAPRYGFEMALV